MRYLVFTVDRPERYPGETTQLKEAVEALIPGVTVVVAVGVSGVATFEVGPVGTPGPEGRQGPGPTGPRSDDDTPLDTA